MTRADELNAEIRNQAVRLYPRCTALFELPTMVYWQIIVTKYYTTQETAKALGVCYSRVLQLRKQGLLDAYSHGEKGSKSKFYFRVEDVERYKQSRDNPEQPPLRKVSTRETD